jgi:hypothetical protein
VTANTRARLETLSARTLSTEEARAWIEAPIGDDEREQVLSLVRWFRRRYPTPLDRLAYIRVAYARWRRVTACAASTASSASDTR